ncbi:MAG: helix-turn-helix domain-containing protein [Thermotogae bacterium]|jgi:transcriptional regulator with XRE-family HTH domain|nr:helix-turn-helix domain-containing protein [Thermotogota bacterium]MCL5033218.1 helix-turn-helix domain-containing protein [Thermotogota bacterium]
MKSFEEMKKRLMSNKDFATAYNKRKPLAYFITDVFILRKKSGWTQKDLAEKMKTKVSNISRIESGKQNISFLTMQKITEILGGNLLITMRKDDFVELSQRSKDILKRLSENVDNDPKVVVEKSLEYYESYQKYNTYPKYTKQSYDVEATMTFSHPLKVNSVYESTAYHQDHEQSTAYHEQSIAT